MNQHYPSPTLTRRNFVQAGFAAALGLGLPALLAGKATAAEPILPGSARKAKSVIIIFLTGAASHHEHL